MIKTAMIARKGITLLELIVVVAIIAILVGLLLVGVTRVRSSAAQLQCTNNQKQLVLAAHANAGDHRGLLPGLCNVYTDPVDQMTGENSLFTALCPYLEQGHAAVDNNYSALIALYTCPGDPTIYSNGFAQQLGSYAANAQVFEVPRSLQNGFPDGTSNTIAFAEHYSNCGSLSFNWVLAANYLIEEGLHRTTFADGGPAIQTGYGSPDCYPVTSGQPPTTLGSIPDLTFQVCPSIQNCDPRIPQTPHTGMQVGFADGTVRTIFGDITTSIFWGLVTPNGGEVVSTD